ncbi:MAG: MucR family transcriptional regulator [Pseudomonadota bacterium]
MSDKEQNSEVGESLHLATQIIAAYVSNNKVDVDSLPGLMTEVYESLQGLAAGEASLRATRDPAVPISKSVTPDYVICLEDGKKLKMLKRYLRTHYNLTPEEYKRKWNLPPDYPMVAPNYAKRRSAFAKQIGLGTQRSGKKTVKKATKKKSTKRRGRPRKAA